MRQEVLHSFPSEVPLDKERLMSDKAAPKSAPDVDLSAEEARAVIETIADVEREEAEEMDRQDTA